ncbi:MAG: PBP1A family penicillin-binding protein [Myxococcales bacterium]|nr:PBP1A family penicillin-binding protein [Myxococcales bacterium]
MGNPAPATSPAHPADPPAVAPRKRRPPRVFSLMRLLGALCLWGLSLGAAGAAFGVRFVNRTLPSDLSQLVSYQPIRGSSVLSSDGELIGRFSIQNRRIVALDRMPSHVPAAFIAAEDRRFWQHGGFDIFGIGRAAWANLKSDGITQGGSTLTQQIIKQTILAGEEQELIGLVGEARVAEAKRQKYRRKAKEVILAVRVERELSKADILTIYLNHIYLGNGAYGVAAAAAAYFGKTVENLTIAEAAMLAGLVAAPSEYAPHRNITDARKRQRYVLDRMLQDGYISDAEFLAARDAPIGLIKTADLNALAAPYFVETLRQEATAKFGNDVLFHNGLRFYTTLDTRMQAAAEAALREGIEALDRRLGFRGPIARVSDGEKPLFDQPAYRPFAPGMRWTDTSSPSLTLGTRYVAMVTDITRGVVVDLGGKELPVDAADVKSLLAWRGPKGVRLAPGDLILVRLVPPPGAVATSPAAAPAEGTPTPDLDDAPAKATPVLPTDTEDAERATAVRVAQLPSVEGALVAIEPATGRVVAMVGGYDWQVSQFNRVTQAKRQIGSAIKPFIYGAALSKGHTQIDVLFDAPIAVPTATGIWTPSNYDGKFHGPVTLRTALAKSLNTISVQLLIDAGLDRVIAIMRGFGISSAIPRHVSISLGTPDLTLMEVTAAYAGIAAGGRRVTPRLYDLVTQDGKVLDDRRNLPAGPEVLQPEVAYVLTDMMRSVVEAGTARRAKSLGRPAAGKTGTSANYRDVWFVGYTTDLVCGVWLGRDNSTPIANAITGGTAAVPIWLSFMAAAHPATPARDFEIPTNVVFASTGVQAGNQTGWIPFARGTVPAQFAHPTTKPMAAMLHDYVPPETPLPQFGSLPPAAPIPPWQRRPARRSVPFRPPIAPTGPEAAPPQTVPPTVSPASSGTVIAPTAPTVR